jgi:hypothetical protein
LLDVTMPKDHVDVREDTIEDRTSLDISRPAQERRHAPAAFPVDVFLRAERRVRAIRPGVVLGTVVCGIHDDGVVGDTQLVELGEQLADPLVVSGPSDRRSRLATLAALAAVLVGEVGPEMQGSNSARPPG